MKTIIITTESFPNGFAATHRIKCYAKAISKKSTCKVIVANRCEDVNHPLGNMRTSGTIDGYSYSYIGKTTRKPNGIVLKMLANFIDVLQLCIKLIVHLEKSDRIIFYSYDMHLMSIIIFVTHIKGAKIYYELCEHPSIQCKGYPTKMGIQSQTAWIKKHLGKLDGIFCISHALERLMRDTFENKIPTLLIPILYENNEYRSPIGNINHKRPYILHTGSLSQHKDGIIDSLTAFAKANVDMDFLITGKLESSPNKLEILQTIKENHLENKVKFIGFLSDDNMITYQRGAYLAIVNKEDNLQNQYCFATKIAEYLHAKCLLLTTKVGEQTYYLKDKEDCLFFNPKDIDTLANMIRETFVNKHYRDTIAAKGSSLAEKYFYCENYTDKLLEFIS